MGKALEFPKAKYKRIDYETMEQADKIKRVGITLAIWQSDYRISPGVKAKLKRISPETMVRMFDQYEGWQLYANRRIGVIEKTKIIVDMYQKVNE